jgi:hypothetical protein
MRARIAQYSQKMNVITNTTVLSNFASINQLDLLHRYGHVRATGTRGNPIVRCARCAGEFCAVKRQRYSLKPRKGGESNP